MTMEGQDWRILVFSGRFKNITLYDRLDKGKNEPPPTVW